MSQTRILCEKCASEVVPKRSTCYACARIGATQLDYIKDDDTGVASRALYHDALDANDHTCGRTP